MHSKVTQPIGQEHLPSLLLDQPGGQQELQLSPMMQPPPQPLEDQMQLSGGWLAALHMHTSAAQQHCTCRATGSAAALHAMPPQ